MPKQIYLIRHGETDYNATRRMQGWLDIPLNKIGHEQAKNTASKLAGLEIDHIYSSDLRRAHETAQHVTRVIKKELQTTTSLRERDMGIFAGWAWESEHDQVKDRLWLEFQKARDEEDLDWNEHQGESMRQMKLRISTFLQGLHEVHQGQAVIIVTHGGTINHILEHYEVKSSSSGFRMITNASILILEKSHNQYQLKEL